MRRERSYENARPSKNSEHSHDTVARPTIQDRRPALHAIAEDARSVSSAAFGGPCHAAGPRFPAGQTNERPEAVRVVLSCQQRRTGIPTLADAVHSVANHVRRIPPSV